MFLPGGGPSRLTARRALALLQRLPDTSALAAELAAMPRDESDSAAEDTPAWRRWYGWGADRAMLADLWDLTAQLQLAKKAPRYPRPSTVQTGGNGPTPPPGFSFVTPPTATQPSPGR